LTSNASVLAGLRWNATHETRDETRVSRGVVTPASAVQDVDRLSGSLADVARSLPIALIEAMSSGLPCVATRLEGSTDGLIDDRVNGLLIEPDDEAGLTASLQRLLTDIDAAARLGAAARDTVLERYSIEKTAALWLAAYQELSTT